ncbi:hypothetical protein [Haladaptatus sp. CMSO5]|uniref:hypothetical protein n=1 Tax=Haladaptatus sp. CMSO5 TaxID=3120514 RepID=UPI002FCE6592
MSSIDNADWGLTVETAACERWSLEHVANEASEPDWHDAVATEGVQTGPETRTPGLVVLREGAPIEIKACRARMTDGASTRRGRWWIRERSHERLLAAEGAYVLAVYDPDCVDSIRRLALLDARTVDSLIETWSPCGASHHAEYAARLPWSRVFDSLDVEAKP